MENKISDLQAGMTIGGLSQQIVQVQDVMQVQAAHAVNLSLTARNWLIGHYIVEYEQHGEDRAQYGNALLKALAKRLNRRGLGERRLYEFRLLYTVYPQLRDEITHFILSLRDIEKLRSITAISSSEKSSDAIWRLPTAISHPAESDKWLTEPSRLFNRLSTTHLIYLSNINDDLKRAFYEQEAIAGC